MTPKDILAFSIPKTLKNLRYFLQLIMVKIDLHAHTNISDGKLFPQELIDLAIERKIPVIAITDHDNIDAIEQALQYAKDRPLEIVPGVEFTADPKDLAKEIHVVGLFIDYKNKEILELRKKHKEAGQIRGKKIIKKLNELGYDITFEELMTTGHSGRPFISKILMNRYPKFKERSQVFDELLGKQGKAFVKAETTPMKEIISVIHNAGGTAILAHPAYLRDNAEKVINEFVKLKGDGIEVDCRYESFGEHAQSLREKFRKIAKDNNLLISGGTDFHSTELSGPLGEWGITQEEFSKLKNAKEI